MTDPIHTSVVAVYVHGDRSTRPDDTEPTPMLAMERVDAVAGQGIRQDRRFFRQADPGRVRKRQVSLIDEGTIERLEAQFGLIERRHIKSQIILQGDLRLPDLIGAVLEFENGPIMEIALERDPCYAMDLIAPGMRVAMMDGEQGALAMVIQSGQIHVGQRVTVRVETAVSAPVGNASP